ASALAKRRWRAFHRPVERNLDGQFDVHASAALFQYMRNLGRQTYVPQGLVVTEHCFTRSGGSPLEKEGEFR
ncbi:MAG: hypothetical protein WBD18_03050, partial [Phycisphaerae bacterium]